MNKETQTHIHVVGVAGVGMSALAQALHDAGYVVSGSDRYIDQGQGMEVLDRLRLAGIKLTPQDGSGLNDATSCIAVSTAIESDNADIREAQRLNIPIVHRAEMLARLAAGKRLLAVTGTAGKTTVTGMIGHICAEAGLDPVVVNGGAITNWQAPDRVGNVRKGHGSLWIIEADESDRSLLSFRPHFSVITNISKDHFELDEVTRLFRAFRDRTETWTILGPPAASVLDHQVIPSPVVQHRENGNWFVWEGVEYPSPMPGQHNADNACLAVRTALSLGISSDIIKRALSTFRGIHRRLEVVARSGGITVLDDYAHNPAKIAASWQAAAEQTERVIGIWRPHGYGPLSLLFDELVQSFAQVCRKDDLLFILPVYYAGGTAKKTQDAERLASVLSERGVLARFVDNYDQLSKLIRELMKSGDVILGMGARDPELPTFLRGIIC
jgi:UDP-N-acetylmuramate--alanine ligase